MAQNFEFQVFKNFKEVLKRKLSELSKLGKLFFTKINILIKRQGISIILNIINRFLIDVCILQ